MFNGNEIRGTHQFVMGGGMWQSVAKFHQLW